MDSMCSNRYIDWYVNGKCVNQSIRTRIILILENMRQHFQHLNKRRILLCIIQPQRSSNDEFICLLSFFCLKAKHLSKYHHPNRIIQIDFVFPWNDILIQFSMTNKFVIAIVTVGQIGMCVCVTWIMMCATNLNFLCHEEDI